MTFNRLRITREVITDYPRQLEDSYPARIFQSIKLKYTPKVVIGNSMKPTKIWNSKDTIMIVTQSLSHKRSSNIYTDSMSCENAIKSSKLFLIMIMYCFSFAQNSKSRERIHFQAVSQDYKRGTNVRALINYHSHGAPTTHGCSPSATPSHHSQNEYNFRRYILLKISSY